MFLLSPKMTNIDVPLERPNNQHFDSTRSGLVLQDPLISWFPFRRTHIRLDPLHQLFPRRLLTWHQVPLPNSNLVSQLSFNFTDSAFRLGGRDVKPLEASASVLNTSSLRDLQLCWCQSNVLSEGHTYCLKDLFRPGIARHCPICSKPRPQ